MFVRHTCFIPRAAHSQLTHLTRVKLFAVFPSQPKKNCAQTEERHIQMTETPTADKGPIFALRGSHGRMDPGEGRIGPSERPLQSLLQSRACSWGRAGRKSWRVSRAEQSQCCMGPLHRRAEGNLPLPAKDKPLRITSRMPTRK